MRMANGVTMPRSRTGGTNSISEAANEPMTAPVETAAMPFRVMLRNGLATNGTTAMSTAPASTTTPSTRGSGQRSAILPPSTYPSDRAIRIRPITFAQIMVDEP